MPYPEHLAQNLESQYGAEKGQRVLHAMKNKDPEGFAKKVSTARKPGHGGVREHGRKKNKLVDRMIRKGK